MSHYITKSIEQAKVDTVRYPDGKFPFIDGLRQGMSEQLAARFAAKLLEIPYFGEPKKNKKKVAPE